MNLFNFNLAEILTFFAVLVRYTTLISILPFYGDRVIPAPVKILLGLSSSVVVFPTLVASGKIDPHEALAWSASSGKLIEVISCEVLVGLGLGFSARILFDGIAFGANLVGNFMGFASASTYDPHQEAQTEIIAQFQTVVAMLIFLALDGHHQILKASVESYQLVGVGRGSFGMLFSQKIVEIFGQVFLIGLQLAAPVGIAIFGVNIAFGILSRAMPQLNVLVLSFAVSGMIGFSVLGISMAEYGGYLGDVFGKLPVWMGAISRSIGGG